jgi:hypothetical protein
MAQLAGLDVCFTEEKLRNIISDLPTDKTPVPNGTQNGFTGRFYKIVWPLIRLDVMSAISPFWSLDSSSFHPLNDSYMVLLRKKAETAEIKGYRSVSLTHSFGKLVAKCLAVRLSMVLDKLVHANQSAYIRGRSIHDNFRTVQLTCQPLHSIGTPSVPMKIDIARAFD